MILSEVVIPDGKGKTVLIGLIVIGMIISFISNEIGWRRGLLRGKIEGRGDRVLKTCTIHSEDTLRDMEQVCLCLNSWSKSGNNKNNIFQDNKYNNSALIISAIEKAEFISTGVSYANLARIVSNEDFLKENENDI